MAMQAGTGRARRYLLDALDGEQNTVDPPVRRGLFANAESVDALRSDHDIELNAMRELVESVRRAVVAGSTAVVLSLIGSVFTLVITR